MKENIFMTSSHHLLLNSSYPSPSWNFSLWLWLSSIGKLQIKLQGGCIMIHCDNQACVDMINSMRNRNNFLQACLRELWLTLVVNNIMLKVAHIPGHVNTLADSLSRWYTGAMFQSRFRALTASFGLQPVTINPQMFSFASI